MEYVFSQNIKNRFHKQYSIKIRILRVIISFVILIIGGLIYVAYRDKSLEMFNWFDCLGLDDAVIFFRNLMFSNGIYGWIKYSLPDGLWLFAYMFTIDSIWNGSKKLISYIFIFCLPLLALLSEFLQYFGLIPGVFDLIDLASYLCAILLFILIKLLK